MYQDLPTLGTPLLPVLEHTLILEMNTRGKFQGIRKQKSIEGIHKLFNSLSNAMPKLIRRTVCSTL